MIVLKIIAVIIGIIIGLVLLYAVSVAFLEWLVLPFSIKDYFEEQNKLIQNNFEQQNTLIEKQIEALDRLNETISKSSKK